MEADCIVNSAVEFAAQTGRLDFLSATLAVLAVILGIGAFPVFFFVQRRAERVAREEVAKILEGAAERVEQIAISEIEQLLPILMKEYGDFAREAAGYDADAISQAQEGGEQ